MTQPSAGRRPSAPPGDRWSRADKRQAGWRGTDAARGSYVELLKKRRRARWQQFSWLAMRALVESLNDRIAHDVDDFIGPIRNRWVASQRRSAAVEHRDADGDFVIHRDDGDRFNFLVLGDPGEQDASQYAVVAPLLARGENTSFMVICSDVIYPAGDVNDYVNGFYIPYADYPNEIYALPGNHDWYDGLNGFMYHFCGAEPLSEETFRRSDFSLRQMISRALWRKPTLPDRDALEAWRSQRPPWSESPPRPPQPGPYYAIVTPSLTLVAIDTGITGGLDREQGEWLLKVSKRHGPKVLLTGKPLIVNGRYQPGEIAWTDDNVPDGRPTVDDIVRDPAHGYVAAIGGDVHNYQRYSVTVPSKDGTDSRCIEYIVAGGGGAFLSATHRIGYVDVAANPLSKRGGDGRIPDVTEKDFNCYPLRGDSLAHFSKHFVPKILKATLWSVVSAIALLIALGLTRWVGDGSLWRALTLGAVGLAAVLAVVDVVVVLVLRGNPLRRSLWFWLLVSGALCAGMRVIDSGATWHWTLIALATLAVVVSVGVFVTQTRWPVPTLILLVGAGGLTLLATLHRFADLEHAATVVLLMLGSAAALRVGFFLRFQARSLPSMGMSVVIWGGLLAGLGFAALSIDGGEAWKVAVTALASYVGLAALILSAYLIVGVGALRVLWPTRWWGLEPDQAVKLVHERLVEYAGPHGYEEPPIDRASAKDAPIDRKAQAIAKVMLPKPGGFFSKVRTAGPVQAFVAEIFDSDDPPFFKDFLRLEVEPGALTIKAYGVTGWADDEKDPQREDCVRIPLPVERPRRFSADGGDAAADPSRSVTPGSPR